MQQKFWYFFSTKTQIGHYFLKQLLLKKIHFLLTLLDIFYKLGVFKVSFVRFIHSQLNTPEKRRRIYYTWMVYRDLQLNSLQIIQSLLSNSGKSVFYLGANDAIFPLRKYSVWKKRLPSVHWEVRPGNHTQIFKIALLEIAAQL
ncbi:MAG TPA: hypothetical protein DCM08_10905 [Microscillaceae bacterium]|nr:hypothetical protein [Microscillaceae bacterium]